MSETTKLIEAIAALAWPLLVAFLLLGLLPTIKKIILSRNFTVKLANVEVSVQDATDKIRKQLDDLNEEVLKLRGHPAPASPGFVPLAAPETRSAPRFGTVLWVDDKPAGNALEVAQLKERGIECVQVRSTAEALSVLGARSDIVAIVSDMGRTEDGQYRGRAGLILLKELQKGKKPSPFLVYTGRRSAAEYDADVRAAGGDGCTASTIDLFAWLEEKAKLQPAPLSGEIGH